MPRQPTLNGPHDSGVPQMQGFFDAMVGGHAVVDGIHKTWQAA
ncbi:MAG: hypothetical protein P8N72_02755 [Flavimaricola sp.]|nr:hypothetical protein [Flavimaricola sp.]